MSLPYANTIPARRKAKSFGRIVVLPFVKPNPDVPSPVFRKSASSVIPGAFGKLATSSMLWESLAPVTTPDGMLHANQTIANEWTMALSQLSGVPA